LRDWDCIGYFDQALARLFEAMIFIPAGRIGKVDDFRDLYKSATFIVEPRYQILTGYIVPALGERPLLVEKPIPFELEGEPFVLHRLFDWDLMGYRDFRLLEISRAFSDSTHYLVDVKYTRVYLSLDKPTEPSAPKAPG
jgi:hypothetical protein